MKYLETPFHVAFHFVQVIPVSFKFNVGLQIPFVTAFARPPQWMEVGATFCAETLTLFCILLTSICDMASCLGLMKVLNLDISNKDCHFYNLLIYLNRFSLVWQFAIQSCMTLTDMRYVLSHSIARWNFKLTENRTDDALPANSSTPECCGQTVRCWERHLLDFCSFFALLRTD